MFLLHRIGTVSIPGDKWLPEMPPRDLVRDTTGCGEMGMSALATLSGFAGGGGDGRNHGG